LLSIELKGDTQLLICAENSYSLMIAIQEENNSRNLIENHACDPL